MDQKIKDGSGETWNWTINGNVATSGGRLDEMEKMPESNATITKGSLTVYEYGLSIPFTSKVQMLGKQDVEDMVDNALADDAKKVLDSEVRDQFDDSPLIAVGTAAGTATASNVTFETDGTPSNTNNAGLDKYHVQAIVDWMKERNIPTFSDGDYFCIGRPTSFRVLKNQLESVSQYTDAGFRKIMNGEQGRYEGCRFLEQTNIASQSWSNSKSDVCHFFGKDTVAEAVVVPEEIRGKIPDDYGRGNGMAWYALLGFGLVRSAAADATIVRWESDS